MSNNKIVGIAAIKKISQSHKSNGKKVVFTNGCFDLLHVGHIRYLESSKAQGDILIVGLNSDGSVKKIKGDKRPVVCEEERAELLASLVPVDHVVIFDELTPRSLIDAIRPDVLVKGSDWKKGTIVGADLVESYGGRVFRAPFTDGRSTASLIDMIVKRFS